MGIIAEIGDSPAAITSGDSTLDAFEWNNTSWIRASDPLPTAAELGDRFEVVTLDDGLPAVAIRRRVGDALWGGNRIRAEAAWSDFACQIAGWVAAEEEGADIDKAYRKYRWDFMVDLDDTGRPDTMPTAFLKQSASDPFLILGQLFGRIDDNPADEAGSPPLSLQLRRNARNRVRFALVDNVDPDAVSTANNLREVWSQPCISRQFHSIYVKAEPWDWSTLGNVSIYVDRWLVWRRRLTGNCRQDKPSTGGGGIHPKLMGIYAGPSSLVQGLNFTAFFRNARIGDKDATDREMYPEIPTDQPVILGRRLSNVPCVGGL